MDSNPPLGKASIREGGEGLHNPNMSVPTPAFALSIVSTSQPLLFNKLKDALGNDCASHVMEYFIDQNTLHQYAQHLERLRLEYQFTSVDYHVRVITALLSCRRACWFPDSPFLHTNAIFTNLTVDELFPKEYEPTPYYHVRLDIWKTSLNEQYYTPHHASRGYTVTIDGCKHPISRAVIFRVLLQLMMRAYYILFDIPYSVRRAIDIDWLIQEFEWDGEVMIGQTRSGARAELAKTIGVMFR